MRGTAGVGRAGQLRKPELDQAHGELNAALHRLHLLAGRPSLADIARVLKGAGISRSTIHDAFCSPRLPKWKVIDALVEVLSSQAPGGRPEEDQRVLYEVWLRAAQEGDELDIPLPRGDDSRESTLLLMQRMLLPRTLPSLDGVEIAVRYLPARDPHRSGGDWFDVIPLLDDKVALVAGDVMGSSVLSVALMGQMRSALNVLIHLGLPPHEVLNQLSEQAQRLSGDQLATTVCAIYDPATRTISLSSAGHLPPFLLDPEGTSYFLEVPPGPPIGLGMKVCETVAYDVSPGSAVFFFTDGLVESRSQDLSVGLRKLQTCLTRATEAAGRQPPPLEDLCDVAMESSDFNSPQDDIVLLAARFA